MEIKLALTAHGILAILNALGRFFVHTEMDVFGAEAKERWNKKVEGMNDRQKLIRMYENLVQEIKTAENNILFFTGKSKSGNKLVDDMRKKIDTLKNQLADLENKINQMDAE